MLLASQRNVTALLTDKIQVLQLREVKQSTVYKNGIFLAKMLKMSIEVALLGAALLSRRKPNATLASHMTISSPFPFNKHVSFISRPFSFIHASDLNVCG